MTSPLDVDHGGAGNERLSASCKAMVAGYNKRMHSTKSNSRHKGCMVAMETHEKCLCFKETWGPVPQRSQKLL